MGFINQNHKVAYWTEKCPACGQGCLCIVKNSLNNNFSLMCDDCEEEWKNPLMKEEDNFLLDYEPGSIRNATLEEIVALGWDKYVQGNYVDFDCV